ncbi:hypothetical protein GCM10007276_23410 [Agaricicola taiwanensis]|uniref:DUF3597 domain-containing protein n=1 Tax=Agaricicola taiwanensis TaxID=591372 RepID=A0A8J2YIL7_9RHOB|nr:DUF3597 domain-containing protein [Agaricicola taiwanensis]GGE45513.1 hypothetical protein GCM10007276_23410 [Agaricicola taiwanensis]
MGIFDTIKNAIFGRAEAAPMPTSASASATPEGRTAAQTIPTPQPAGPGGGTVDVAAVLEQAVASKNQKLNWRTSIVDLMKALDLDSSLSARKELAKELNYTGDTNDSATMNMWLHKALMQKLAENGGKVPADLKD